MSETSRAVPRVVVVTGSDRFEVMGAFAREKDRLTEGTDPAFGVDEIDGDGPDAVRAAVDAVRTPAMFGDRRVVVLRDGLSADTVAALQGHLDDPGGGGTLVIAHVRTGAVPKAVTEFLKAVKRSGGLVVETKAPPVRTKDLAAYVAAVAVEKGLRLAAPAAAFVAAPLGPASGAVSSLLDQLATAHPDGRIGIEDVEEVLAGPVLAAVYELTDAVDAGDAREALYRLGGILRTFHPLQVQAVLVGHVRRLLTVLEIEPRSAQDVEVALRVKSYPARKLLEQARRLGPDPVRAAHREVARADLALRGTTGLPAEAVLEVLVVRLARLLGRAGRARRR